MKNYIPETPHVPDPENSKESFLHAKEQEVLPLIEDRQSFSDELNLQNTMAISNQYRRHVEIKDPSPTAAELRKLIIGTGITSVSLNGLQSLNTEIADVLAEWVKSIPPSSVVLELDGLKSLDKDYLSSIFSGVDSKTYSSISLGSLKEVSQDLLKFLIENFTTVRLNGITHLDRKFAETLFDKRTKRKKQGFGGANLIIDGVVSYEPGAIKSFMALPPTNIQSLSLNGLKKFPEELRNLNFGDRRLSMDGVTDLTDAAMSFRCYSLSLKGVKVHQYTDEYGYNFDAHAFSHNQSLQFHLFRPKDGFFNKKYYRVLHFSSTHIDLSGFNPLDPQFLPGIWGLNRKDILEAFSKSGRTYEGLTEFNIKLSPEFYKSLTSEELRALYE